MSKTVKYKEYKITQKIANAQRILQQQLEEQQRRLTDWQTKLNELSKDTNAQTH